MLVHIQGRRDFCNAATLQKRVLIFEREWRMPVHLEPVLGCKGFRYLLLDLKGRS